MQSLKYWEKIKIKCGLWKNYGTFYISYLFFFCFFQPVSRSAEKTLVSLFLRLKKKICDISQPTPTPSCCWAVSLTPPPFCVALGPCWNAEAVHFGVSPGFRAGWSHKRISETKWVQKDNRLCADNAIEVGSRYLSPPRHTDYLSWNGRPKRLSLFDLAHNTLLECLCERNSHRMGTLAVKIRSNWHEMGSHTNALTPDWCSFYVSIEFIYFMHLEKKTGKCV